MISDKLRFGVSYCPYAKSGDVSMKFWERDFQTMKKLHFNTLRCFIAWDRIERIEGELDFSKTDYIFELAEKHGIEVILNIGGVFDCYGGVYPPRWLIYDYQCQHIVESPSLKQDPFGPMHLLCPDDPIFTMKAKTFTSTAIKRYASSDMLCGWNVWNEASVHHMCYCPLTIGNFREWLKKRYSDNLALLNEKWGSEFPLDFRDWDMIEPGLGSGFRSGGHVARLDWMLYNRDRVAGWIDGVNKLVKKFDYRERPTTSNVVVHGAASIDGRQKALPDIWSQNRSLDVGGYSFYSEVGTPSDCSYMLSSVRSSSSAPDRSFWILETSAGQTFHSQYYPGNCCENGFRIAAHWLAVLHGSKTILLWKFGGRVTDCQTDMYNLTGWDGGITARAELNAEFASILLKNEDLFLDKSYHADCAILFSPDSHMFNAVDNSLDHFDRAINSRLGAYKLLRDLRIQTDIVSDAQVMDGKLFQYRVLIVPWYEAMNEQIAEKITGFIRSGGTVIADRCFCLKSMDGHIHFRAPGYGLTEVFGGYINDFKLSPLNEQIHTDHGYIPINSDHYSQIHIFNGTKVIGRYNDNTFAIISNQYGTGRSLLFGSEIFTDYNKNPNIATRKIIVDELEQSGVISEYQIEGDANGVEFGALIGQNGDKVHFILNMNHEERHFSFSIKSSKKKYKDLLSGNIYEGHNDISLLPWGVLVLY